MKVTDPAHFSKTGFDPGNEKSRRGRKPFANAVALQSVMIRNWLIGLLIVFAVVNFGYRTHLRTAHPTISRSGARTKSPTSSTRINSVIAWRAAAPADACRARGTNRPAE